MVHCPICGKEVNKPSKEQKNHKLTIQAYNCKNCHNYFKSTVNETLYAKT
jgi:transposase-like protein